MFFFFWQIRIPLSNPNTTKESGGGEGSSPGGSGRPGDAVSDSELPEYLPEDEDDSGECTPDQDPSTALAPAGVAFKDAASSLFSAAASLLQQSFYWWESNFIALWSPLFYGKYRWLVCFCVRGKRSIIVFLFGGLQIFLLSTYDIHILCIMEWILFSANRGIPTTVWEGAVWY